MSICRTCLQKEAEAYCSLFKTIHHVTLQEMYHSLTGLSVSREDGLPDYVCQECADFLVTCNNFRKKCIKSDAQLRNDLAKGSGETELVRVEEFECLEVDSNEPTQIKIYFDESHYILPDKTGGQEEIVPNEQKLTFHIEDDSSVRTNDDESGYSVYDVTEEEELVEITPDAESENGQSYEFFLDSEEILEKPQTSSVDETEEPTSTDNATTPSTVRCCACPALQFDTIEGLKLHSLAVHAKNRTENKLRLYECDICYRRYTQNDHFLNHKATIHLPKKVYDCKSCDASFKSRTALHSHNKSKHVCERTYVCEICQKGFYTSNTLLSHRLIHGEKKFRCDKCSKMFARHWDLRTHQKSHSNERPHGCSVCKMRFKTLAHLRGHQAVHTGERSIKCRICGKGFTTYGDRRVHELEHENIHPFKCTFCDKRYGRNYKLQAHIKKMHTGERPFVCCDCSQSFIQRWELTAHRRTVHGEGEGLSMDVIVEG
ncbi:zinc finger protein 271-like [Anopheles maculipalpis]|uniref:zinc finger protein 271-like n=1 Tax=Anopheles maculipalpis TaxID=1496333 RepID=UPI0021596D6C|nr:zinc finger protein 271-like [Anopheles maculipalpis]